MPFLFFFLSTPLIMAQCFEPDTNIWKDTWVSCDKTPNPISSYGDTHWILYDLGNNQFLGSTWVWNTNDPTRLNQGFDLVKFDYSEDGENWTLWGEMKFPKADGAAIYGGFAGPDFEAIQARYVLLTVLSTHGDVNCAGIAEIKFNLNKPPVEIPESEEYVDDCAAINEFYLEEVTDTEIFIFWEVDENIDEPFFVFRYREIGENFIEIELEEPEVFINGLNPMTTYEFQILIECDDELLPSDIETFTTLEEGAVSECAGVDDIWLESTSTTSAHIAWNAPNQEDFFYVEYGIIDGTEWIELELEATEINLENLTPFAEYELIIGIECGDDVQWSELFFFTTDGNTTGTTTIVNPDKLKVYPNPTAAQVTLEYVCQETDFLNYSIKDISGKALFRASKQMRLGLNQISIDMSSLPAGIYILETLTLEGRQQSSQKVVKQ